MEEKIILKLTDGGLTDVTEDSEHYGGCETCDFGAKFSKEVCFYTTKGFGTFKVTTSYGYGFSISTIMKILFNNLETIEDFTEKEFLNWFEVELQKETGFSIDSHISLND